MILKRLLKYVKVGNWNECWPWLGCRKSRRYGSLKVNYKTILAHRLMYQLTIGDIPDGMECMHTCDNTFCLNPLHIRIGTHLDNMLDMVNKGRQAKGDRSGSRLHPEKLRRGDNHPYRLRPEIVPRGDNSGARKHPERLARGLKNGRHTMPERTARGERHARAVMTEESVRDVREKYAIGHRISEIAANYGVSYFCIRSVVNRRTWKHI